MVTVHGKDCVSDKSVKIMECLFLCWLRKFGWWSEARPGKHSHHSRSHRQDGRLSEKSLPCHTTNVGGEGGCQRLNSMDNSVRSECVRALGFEATHWPAKGNEYGDRTSKSVSVLWRPRFPGTSAGKVLLIVFFIVQCLLFVEFLKHRRTIISNVYWETLQSLSKFMNKKQKLQEGCVGSMVTHVHPCTGSHKRNCPNGKSLTIHITAQTCHPVIFICLIPWKKHLKVQRFKLDDELKDAVKNWGSSRPQQGMLWLVNELDCCAQAYDAHLK